MSTAWVVAFIVQWIAVIATAIVVIGLLKRTAGALEQAEASRAAPVSLGGIPVGSRTPEFIAYDGCGPRSDVATLTTEELIAGPTILLFMERHCPPCRELGASMNSTLAWPTDVDLRLVLDDEDGTPDWLPGDVPAVYQRERELSRAFENSASPQAYLLDQDRVVLAKRIIRNVDDLHEIARIAEPTGGDAQAVQFAR